MTILKTIPNKVRHAGNRVTLPPKQIDPIYNSPEFIRWRAAVKQRAGYRCEYIDSHGMRCSIAAPERMYADHIRELRDGGSLTDVSNGQCLCRMHHEIKTIEQRKQRLRKVVV